MKKIFLKKGKRPPPISKRIIRDSEENHETYPKTDDLYSKIIHYEASRIELEIRTTENQANHTLSTGNWLIEFLKSHIEIERELQEAAMLQTKLSSKTLGLI